MVARGFAWLWGKGVHGCGGLSGCRGACVVVGEACVVAGGMCGCGGCTWLLGGVCGWRAGV